MSDNKPKNATEDLMAELMKDLEVSSSESLDDGFTMPEGLEVSKELSTSEEYSSEVESTESKLLSVNLDSEKDSFDLSSMLSSSSAEDMGSDEHENDLELSLDTEDHLDLNMSPLNSSNVLDHNLPSNDIVMQAKESEQLSSNQTIDINEPPIFNSNDATKAIEQPLQNNYDTGDGEKTVAIAGYSNRNDSSNEHDARVSVGQVRGAFSSGYAAWGSSDSQLAQAENLRIAQEKILELENENEKLRLQNEELVAASEIVKERADLLTAQVHEFKNDRDSLEQSFKNEINLVRSQYHRKESELQKAQMKIDELDSRLKFDMKKIRIRERELENRLELIRAEKSALVKSKDEQILDLRRKMDQLQLEVDSFRQKCVDLNKVIDVNQDSFKRTVRALRLAMANLELQEENKVPLKKAD